jgi:ABC-type multidrug transport system ATPase subunit
VCQRVVVVHRGRVIVEEPIAALKARATRSTRVRVRLLSGDTAAFATVLGQQTWASGIITADDGVTLETPPDARSALVALAEADGVTLETPPDARSALVALAEAHGGLRELAEERLSLEAVFRDLTGQQLAHSAPAA